ncbi:hypothetical protein THRCLA_07997, partial [Thraustotheca clavata]
MRILSSKIGISPPCIEQTKENRPMKAYLSQAFPWTHLINYPTSSNFTQFNQTTLELYQEAYNNNRLLMSTRNSIPQDQCLSTFILGLPGVLFYTDGIYNILCSLATMKETFDSKLWHNRALVQIHISYSYLFVYLTRSMVIEQVLIKYGHKAKAQPGRNWSYDVVWGDPTALVLMNPFIATAFTIDYWFSVDRIATSIMQMTQSGDSIEWFTYAALCITSIFLKRKGKEHDG